MRADDGAARRFLQLDQSAIPQFRTIPASATLELFQDIDLDQGIALVEIA
jgi:hypothetical protein